MAKKQMYKMEREISEWDFEPTKEFLKKVLETNIAYKTMLKRNTGGNDMYAEMCENSIQNSYAGLRKIENVKCVESLNHLLRNADKLMPLFSEFLALVSGSLNDPNFYAFDLEYFKEKERRKNGC